MKKTIEEVFKECNIEHEDHLAIHLEIFKFPEDAWYRLHITSPNGITKYVEAKNTSDIADMLKDYLDTRI